MLGAERDSLPPEIAAEVRDFFTFCENWLTTQMKQGRQESSLDLPQDARSAPAVSILIVRPQCLQCTASGSCRLRPQSGQA